MFSICADFTSCRVVESAGGKHRWNVMERFQWVEESGVAGLIYPDISVSEMTVIVSPEPRRS